MKNIHRAERESSNCTTSKQQKNSRPEQGRGRNPAAKTEEMLLGCHRAASAGIIEHFRAAGSAEPLIVAEDMIVGDPWCNHINIGDHLHLSPHTAPLPGELIAIEDIQADSLRIHRLVSFDGETWVLRSRGGRLITLRSDDASYLGVVAAITQIRSLLVDRKTFDPWDALQGRCVGFAGPHPSTAQS